jgi:hypothetical protein
MSDEIDRELARLQQRAANPLWTKAQETLMIASTKWGKSAANMDPSSSSAQTPPRRPAALPPIYQKILGAKRRK